MSRPTIRRAIAALVDAGRLTVVRGRGTFVTKPGREQTANGENCDRRLLPAPSVSGASLIMSNDAWVGGPSGEYERRDYESDHGSEET